MSALTGILSLGLGKGKENMVEAKNHDFRSIENTIEEVSSSIQEVEDARESETPKIKLLNWSEESFLKLRKSRPEIFTNIEFFCITIIHQSLHIGYRRGNVSAEKLKYFLQVEVSELELAKRYNDNKKANLYLTALLEKYDKFFSDSERITIKALHKKEDA